MKKGKIQQFFNLKLNKEDETKKCTANGEHKYGDMRKIKLNLAIQII